MHSVLKRRVFKELRESSLSDKCIRTFYQLPLTTRSRFPKRVVTRLHHVREASSSTRWKARQVKDHFAREAKVQGLKSRAAFKLLEINQKYKIFKAGNTVVDLGYAPGSWSQVAIDRTSPNGRVIGIDIIPAQPPRGVSTIQGNFLSPAVQAEVRTYIQDPNRGRARTELALSPSPSDTSPEGDHNTEKPSATGRIVADGAGPASISTEAIGNAGIMADGSNEKKEKKLSLRERDVVAGRMVDVVLSDMSAPWAQTTGYGVQSVSNIYHRMMNTSGIAFKDHAGSMDLCMAALNFSYDTLRTGGHLVCKFYQGAEDKTFEGRLKKLFEKVHREKPESSRSESKEAYFVALRRREAANRSDVLD